MKAVHCFTYVHRLLAEACSDVGEVKKEISYHQVVDLAETAKSFATQRSNIAQKKIHSIHCFETTHNITVVIQKYAITTPAYRPNVVITSA